MSPAERAQWIDRGDEVPLAVQCELAAVPRSTVYRRLEAVARQPLVDEEDGQLRALIDEEYTNRPFYGSRRMVVFLLLAAASSAASFAVGAALPILVVLLAPHNMLIPLTVATSLTFLAILGGLAAKFGGANVVKGVARVAFWSALSMAAAVGIGILFGPAA